MAKVLVDAENVRRSVWPNIARAELGELAAVWAKQHRHDVVVVWETDETADDRIARDVRDLAGETWVVTSDRGLRTRIEPHVERILGGGAFARELLAFRD